MLYVTFAVSLALLAGANLLARFGQRTRHADGIAGGVLGPLVVLAGCLFTSPVVLVQAAGLGVLAVLKAAGWGRWFGAGSLAVTAGAWACVAPAVWDAHCEYARLREQYPFESMAGRLPPPRPAVPPAFDAARLADDEVAYELAVTHANYWGRRDWQLKRLHDERVELFVNSPGFGQVRMITRRPDEGSLGDEYDAHGKPVPQPARGAAPPAGAGGQTLAGMVRNQVFDFTRPTGWGYRRGDRVAGFQPHAVSGPTGTVQGWTVETVELVGLLLAADPRVYLSESLPRMDAVATTPTRHSDGFESPALARLRAGDELVHDEPAGRLLGAIRSAKQCLQCHGGDRGDLLGAFSYRLRPR